MKKAEQQIINTKVEEFIERFNSENHGPNEDVKRLRSSSAKVYTLEKYFVLQSYNTIVAVIDRDTGEAYDFLRYVYGYTATSAKHISAFFHDYSRSGYYPEMVYTWRAC